MKVLPKDYEKIIEILYRNPFIFYKDIAAQFDNYSTNDIAVLFHDIRNDYINDEAISTFLANNSTPQDSIILINGALKSLFKDKLDQSHQLGVLFEEISNFYAKDEGTTGPIVDPSYSVLYKYMAALMTDKRLPVLSATESGIVLTLMFEVLNFSNEMFSRKTEFTTEFCENIQAKIGQVLLKSVLDDDEWNENNEQALIDAFNIPVVDEKEVMKDANSVKKKLQKNIALLSLNPFKITETEVNEFKEVIDQLVEEDCTDGKDINKIFETMDVSISQGPLIAKANNGQKVIIHQKAMGPAKLHVGSQLYQKGGSIKMSDKSAAEESEINNRYSSHDIIDIKRLKETLQSDEPLAKKSKRSQ